MIVSPAATGSVQSDTPPVSALTAVLGQRVEILVVVDPTQIIFPKNWRKVAKFAAKG